MSQADDTAGNRRDFLYYATAGTGAVAVGAAVWPLVNQMNPSADVLALSSIRVDVSGVEPGSQLTVKWLGVHDVGQLLELIETSNRQKSRYELKERLQATAVSIRLSSVCK